MRPQPLLRPTFVRIHCAEGPSHRAGKTREYTGPDCLSRAHEQLARWRTDAPARGRGYDKVDFHVEFGASEPEVTYEGRYDMQCDDYTTIGQQIVQHLRFDAGEYCPPHMKREAYERYVAEVGEKDMARAWLASIDVEFLIS